MLHDDLYASVLRMGNQVTQLAADCYNYNCFGIHDCFWYSLSAMDTIQISCQPSLCSMCRQAAQQHTGHRTVQNALLTPRLPVSLLETVRPDSLSPRTMTSSRCSAGCSSDGPSVGKHCRMISKVVKRSSMPLSLTLPANQWLASPPGSSKYL